MKTKKTIAEKISKKFNDDSTCFSVPYTYKVRINGTINEIDAFLDIDEACRDQAFTYTYDSDIYTYFFEDGSMIKVDDNKWEVVS